VEGSCQIINIEIPIKMYKVVHTGPKIQLGGLNDGWFNDAYHPGIAFEVKNPAIAPTASGGKTDKRSLVKVFIFIYQLIVHAYLRPALK